jgi:hypothetical protein
MSNVATVQRRLFDLGYSPVQVAGILGNLQQESGRNLDPNVVGDKGTAYGIAQWRGPRFEGLQSFAQQRGIDWRDPSLQADYIHHELNTTERRAGDLLRNAKTADDAAKAFIGFERPAGFTWDDPTKGHGWDNRIKNAYAVLGQPMPEAGTSVVQNRPTQMASAAQTGATADAGSKINWAGLLSSMNEMQPQSAQPMAVPTLDTGDPTMLIDDFTRRRPRGLI